MNDVVDTPVLNDVVAEPIETPGEDLEAGESLSASPPVDARNVDDPLDLLHKIVKFTVSRGGSDIHLHAGSHPVVRLAGRLRRIQDSPVWTPADMDKLSQQVMSEKQYRVLIDELQVDLSIGVKGVGRMRVNAFYQRGTIAMALRVINSVVPHPDKLGLPEQVMKFVEMERGLVLLTGATGSGKSTTIASMLNQINQNYSKHIITIEDPIEFLFSDDKCIISQRELGTDAKSFGHAMKGALREDPDVILLGEMRDPETIETALTAAETGHLVFSTVHAPNTSDTITRVVSTFPSEVQQTIRAKLSQNLMGVISQRLVPTADGEGRTVACEVMTVSERVRELMLDPLLISEIRDLVKGGETVEGMLAFDHHLLQLCQTGVITEESALQYATSATDMRLLLDGFT